MYELYLIHVHKVHGFSKTLQAAEPKVSYPRNLSELRRFFALIARFVS